MSKVIYTRNLYLILSLSFRVSIFIIVGYVKMKGIIKMSLMTNNNYKSYSKYFSYCIYLQLIIFEMALYK